MFKNEYTLSVDLKKNMTSVVPTFVQYDSATLVFKIFDDGKKYDLSGFTKAEVTHRRPDGSVLMGEAFIEGNGMNQTVRYTYLGEEMEHLGYIDTSLHIFSATKKVSIRPFKVLIVEDLMELYASPASPVVGALQKLIAEVERLIVESEAATLNANTQATHAKTQGDYAKTQGTNAKTETDKMLIVKTNIEASEVTRVSNEDTRKTAETTRNSNETTRKSNEVSRVSVESSRVTAEDARKSTETTRISDENTRKTNETARLSKEATRVTAETDRVTKESARVTAENARATNESTRKTSETDRVANESTRLTDEATRKTNETDRVSTESARVLKEASRVSSETNREQNEATRKTQETARQTNTQNAITGANTARDEANTQANYAKAQADIAKTESSNLNQLKTDVVTATTDANTTKDATELVRVATENVRASTETVRLDTVTAKDATITATTQANTARDNAQIAADNLGHAKAHDMQVQYKKNNVVTYNGSSFMAIRDNLGKIPIGDATDLDWRIIARKGDDGNGVVALYRDTFVATANQTVFTLSHSYDQLQNRVYLVIGGVSQFSPEAFMETSSTKVTLHSGVPAGTTVIANYFGNAPAIVNDLQNQIDSLNTIVQYMDFVAIRLAGDHAKTHGDVAKQSAIDANLAKDNAILATTNSTTATGLANTATTNANTATANAVTATDNANTAADNANNAAAIAGTHTGDTTVHLTPQDRTSWNNKETPDGAQAKATTAETNAKNYADSKVADLVGSAPDTLNALDELATALGNDPNFATSIATQIGTKVDKIAGKGLSTEDFTSTEKTKLTGVEVGANKYTHPTTHSPSIIVQDASNRFMTDIEKTKLTGIEAGANKYTHPVNHPASIIIQDPSNRMLSDAKIAELEAKETVFGSQSKADAAIITAKNYTDNQIKLGVITVSDTAPTNSAGFWLDTSE